MTTIFDPDPRTIRKASTAMFFLTGIVGAFGPAIASDGWAIYAGILLASLAYTIYLRYYCESYVIFISSYFTVAIFIFAFMVSCASYILTAYDLQWSVTSGVLIALALASFVLLMYSTLYVMPADNFPFNISNDRVFLTATDTSSVNPWLIAGCGTGLSTLINHFLGPLNLLPLATTLLFFGVIGFLIHARHRIRGLRTLRAKEKELSISYTFRQIDDIREYRNRAWLTRLVKWVASRLKPSSR